MKLLEGIPSILYKYRDWSNIYHKKIITEIKNILANKGVNVILETEYHASVGITFEIACGNAFRVNRITEYEHNKVYISTESKDGIPRPIIPPGEDGVFCEFNIFNILDKILLVY